MNGSLQVRVLEIFILIFFSFISVIWDERLFFLSRWGVRNENFVLLTAGALVCAGLFALYNSRFRILCSMFVAALLSAALAGLLLEGMHGRVLAPNGEAIRISFLSIAYVFIGATLFVNLYSPTKLEGLRAVCLITVVSIACVIGI